MNRQARRSGVHEWSNCGAVTHVEAAGKLAESCPPVAGIMETRDEPTADNPDPPVFCHRVERVVRYEVTPLRGDGDE